MATNYNRGRYYAPSSSTRLNESYEAHARTQKELAEMIADRNRWRDLYLELIAIETETDNEQ
jgi:hypothetical protein